MPDKPKGKAGRPTIYDETTVKILCAAYATGISLEDAARATKISVATVYGWRRESRENPDGPKGNFCSLLREAQAQSILRAAEDVRHSDPKWFLSRLRPKRFGDPSKRLEVSGPDQGPVQVDMGVQVSKILSVVGHIPEARKALADLVKTEMEKK